MCIFLKNWNEHRGQMTNNNKVPVHHTVLRAQTGVHTGLAQGSNSNKVKVEQSMPAVTKPYRYDKIS
jgi:hypothetical protein